jgi:hypothetical protein
MKKFLILSITVLILFSMCAYAYDNNTPKRFMGQVVTVTVNTGGNIGHLIYKEEYYSKTDSGNIRLDSSRLYFDGNISQPSMTFKIIRPLMSGRPYPESSINSVVMIDNKMILDIWSLLNNNLTDGSKRKINISNNKVSINTENNTNRSKKSPGLDIISGIYIISIIYLFIRVKR